MKSIWNSTWLFLAAGIVVGGLGCTSHPQTAAVVGRVTVGGVAVRDRQIMFIPDRSKGNKGKTSMGRLNDNGEYSLSAYAPGDGAVVGWHKVIIKKPLGSENAVPVLDKAVPVLDKYADLTRPLLSAEVKSGQKNEINFEL